MVLVLLALLHLLGDVPHKRILVFQNEPSFFNNAVWHVAHLLHPKYTGENLTSLTLFDLLSILIVFKRFETFFNQH